MKPALTCTLERRWKRGNRRNVSPIDGQLNTELRGLRFADKQPSNARLGRARSGMREDPDISIQHAEAGNEAVGAGENLGGHFTTRTGIRRLVSVTIQFADGSFTSSSSFSRHWFFVSSSTLIWSGVNRGLIR